MYKKLMTIVLILLYFNVYATMADVMHTAATVLGEGVWLIVKPVDWVDNEGVTEFRPSGKKHIAMEQMKERIRHEWSYRQGIVFNADLAYQNHLKNIIEEDKVPEKKDVLIFWYGVICKWRQWEVKLLHSYPYSLIATNVKWFLLSALAVAGVEKVKKTLQNKDKGQPVIENNKKDLHIEKIESASRCDKSISSLTHHEICVQ